MIAEAAVRLHCFECLKSVSTELPADALVRATILCPECLEHADREALEKVFESIAAGRRVAQRLARQAGEPTQ